MMGMGLISRCGCYPEGCCERSCSGLHMDWHVFQGLLSESLWMIARSHDRHMLNSLASCPPVFQKACATSYPQQCPRSLWLLSLTSLGTMHLWHMDHSDMCNLLWFWISFPSNDVGHLFRCSFTSLPLVMYPNVKATFTMGWNPQVLGNF